MKWRNDNLGTVDVLRATTIKMSTASTVSDQLKNVQLPLS